VIVVRSGDTSDSRGRRRTTTFAGENPDMNRRTKLCAIVSLGVFFSALAAHAAGPGGSSSTTTSTTTSNTTTSSGSTATHGSRATTPSKAYDPRLGVGASVSQPVAFDPKPTLPGFAQAVGAPLVLTPSAPDATKARLSFGTTGSATIGQWVTEQSIIFVLHGPVPFGDQGGGLAITTIPFYREPGHGYLVACEVAVDQRGAVTFNVGDDDQKKIVSTRTGAANRDIWLFNNFEATGAESHWSGMRIQTESAPDAWFGYSVKRCEVQPYTVRRG
jgi:hypothetical protein